MNKAFVREPDNDRARCPRCDAPGVPVRQETLQAFLAPAALQQLTETAFYCPFARCPVAYFDLFDRWVDQTALQRPVYPKDPTAPLCGCFGLTLDDVEQDVREGGVIRVKALLEKSQSPAAHCATASPTGQCCMPEVQRCLIRLRAAAPP